MEHYADPFAMTSVWYAKEHDTVKSDASFIEIEDARTVEADSTRS